MTAPIPASWDIAWRLVRASPDLRIYETHPGGGTYDCLTLISDTVKIDINRFGSIHVHYSPGGEAIGLIPAERWLQRSQETAGTQDLADEVLTFCRIPTGKHSVTPHGVTYRVIARVLAAQHYDGHTWDARSQFEDTSGYGGGTRWPVPSPDMNQLPANQVWVILRDTEPVAWLWDGWLWTTGAERLNLYSRFRHGDSTSTLAALVTSRTATNGTVLPAVQTRDTQPIGSWPSKPSEVD